MESINEIDSDTRASNPIETTDISILRNGKRMINCMYVPFKREGMEKLYELCTQAC